MTITLQNIIRSLRALGELERNALPLKTSYQIMKIHRALDPDFQFFAQQERELLEKYPPKKIDGRNVMFNSREDAEAYAREHAALDNIESEIQIRPIRLRTDAEDIRISAGSLGILEENGIIILEEDESEPEAGDKTDGSGDGSGEGENHV